MLLIEMTDNRTAHTQGKLLPYLLSNTLSFGSPWYRFCIVFARLMQYKIRPILESSWES